LATYSALCEAVNYDFQRAPQGMGQGAAILDAAAAGGRMHSEAMQASMEQRSRSFPSDARQRLTNLQAQQSAQLSGHKVSISIH